jgi:protocatechuate 3,4-dioxygenase beta subunit
MSSKLFVAVSLLVLVALGLVLVLEPMRHADEPATREAELARNEVRSGEALSSVEMSASRWPRDREAPAAQDEPAKAVPEERRVRPEHGFGVEGTVIDSEGDAIAGARVQGFLDLDGTGSYRALGSAITANDGSFFVPVVELENLSRERRSGVEIQLRVRSDGHAPGEWSHGWGEERILRVDPITLEANRQLVSGRIVDREGRAVPAARVAIISWGSSVGDRDLDETETFANGEFHFQGLRWGAFDLFASHPRHGVARFHGTLLYELGAADVGELRLEARETIGGIVVALDGTPLPGVEVQVELGDEDGGDSHAMQTDERGRFEFQSLMPGRYDVSSRIDEDPVASVATGTSDLVLRSKWPSIHLLVRGADGAEVRNAGVSFVEAKDPSKDEPGKRIAFREHWTAPGGSYYLLSETGNFWVHAHEFLGDERYSARELVEIAKGHRRLELRLQLEHRVEVTPVVRAPGGEEITAFRGEVRSIEDGSQLAAFHLPRPLRLRPGSAEFRIVPPVDSFWRPFLERASVPEGGGTVLLRAVERGGGLRLKLGAEGPHGNAFQVQLLEAADPEAPKQLRVDAGVAATEVALRAGAYRVRVSCKGYEPQELSFRLEEGRWTESSVHLRAK